MTIEIITPSSRAHWLELKKSTLGGSQAPALIGVHPWLTPYKLFCIYTGQYEEARECTKILENSIHLPPLERGNFMEDKGIELARMLRPTWDIKSNTILDENSGPNAGHMYIDRESGLSSTPDVFIDKGDFSGTGALQIKTVAPMEFEKHWKNENGEVQFPLYVAVQAVIDATLSGCEWACAGAMVSGFGVDFYLVDIPLIAGLMDRLRREVADFWRRVRENDPYPPDYLRDGAVIRSVYADDSGGEIDLSGNERIAKLAARHIALKEIESAAYAAKNEREIIDPQIIEALGNAQCGTINGLMIEAKTVRRHYKATEAHITSSRPVKIKQRKSP